MSGLAKALFFIIIIAEAAGHLEYGRETFWNRPPARKWNENIAVGEKLDQNRNLLLDNRSDRKRYYVANGCPTSGSGEGRSFREMSVESGVRCCSKDGKSCKTPIDCSNTKMSYEDAIVKCQEIGLRLCTIYELLSGVCCTTGGGCDGYAVWTSTEESDGHLKSGKHLALDGCSTNPDEKFEDKAVKYYDATDKVAGIVCCENDGSACSRKIGENCRSGQNNEIKVTWDEASFQCIKTGKRLCTSQDELDKCCQSGCNYDNLLVWVDVMESGDTSEIDDTTIEPGIDADCIKFRQTSGCKPNGPVLKSMNCSTPINKDWSGYCDCEDGRRTLEKMCNEDVGDITCEEACKNGPGFCKWHATGDCKWNGPREPQKDKQCNTVIPPGASGSCECSTGKVVMKKGCLPHIHFNTCNDACRVDGGWGTWIDSACSVSCGGGTQKRTRVCDNPVPMDSGSDCISDGSSDSETRPCNKHQCAVCPSGFVPYDGGESENVIAFHIASLEKCARDCEENMECRSISHNSKDNSCILSNRSRPSGEKEKDYQFCGKVECEDVYRDCKEWMVPTYGCDHVVSMVCRKTCQICESRDCEWNDWEIGDCSKECGGGIRTNTRTKKWEATLGGTCSEESQMEESCNTQECPVDCIWGEWQSQGCSQSCSDGIEIFARERKQEEMFGGLACYGSSNRTENCNEGDCPQCRWRQTKGCQWDGNRVPNHDKNCDVIINKESGYCECSTLSKTMKKGCEFGEFRTCFVACGECRVDLHCMNGERCLNIDKFGNGFCTPGTSTDAANTSTSECATDSKCPSRKRCDGVCTDPISFTAIAESECPSFSEASKLPDCSSVVRGNQLCKNDRNVEIRNANTYCEFEKEETLTEYEELSISKSFYGAGFFVTRTGTKCSDYGSIHVNDRRTCLVVAETLRAINSDVSFRGKWDDQRILGCYLWSDDIIYFNEGKNGVGNHEVGSSQQQICLSEAKCYCEHQNKTQPLNGIICGSQGSVRKRAGYCQANERCTGANDISQGVDFIDKSELCSLANICYCEHPNERAPLNGIMCGDPLKGNYQRTGYCQQNQRCTGPSDASRGIDASLKKQLCEVVWFEKTNTRCNGNTIKEYPSLSEAKSECEKQSDCEMVEVAMRKNGWNDIIDWQKLPADQPTWIGPFNRTCRGGIYHGIYIGNKWRNWDKSTIWMKDSMECQDFGSVAMCKRGLTNCAKKIRYSENTYYKDECPRTCKTCKDCRFDEECPPSKNAGCRDNICEACPSQCQTCRGGTKCRENGKCGEIGCTLWCSARNWCGDENEHKHGTDCRYCGR